MIPPLHRFLWVKGAQPFGDNCCELRILVKEERVGSARRALLVTHQSERLGQRMLVTVFGASGQTGRLVVAELLDKGHSVRAFLRDPALPLRIFRALLGEPIRDIVRAVTDRCWPRQAVSIASR